MARPAAGTPYTDPCAVADNAEVFGRLLNEKGSQTTYNGATLVSYQDAIDRFGFGVAPFTFTTGGTLTSINLLVSNEPVEALLYKYIGAGSAPIVVPAGTNPVGNPNWQAFSAANLQSLSGLTDPSDLDHVHRTAATLARLAAGDYSAGSKLRFAELAGAEFDVVAGGTPNGYDVRDAGNGNTAVIVNPQYIDHFGAVGDGISNDAPAIQAAMDYCKANGITSIDSVGGKLYRIDSTLRFHDGIAIDFRGSWIYNYSGTHAWTVDPSSVYVSSAIKNATITYQNYKSPSNNLIPPFVRDTSLPPGRQIVFNHITGGFVGAGVKSSVTTGRGFLDLQGVTVQFHNQGFAQSGWNIVYRKCAAYSNALHGFRSESVSISGMSYPPNAVVYDQCTGYRNGTSLSHDYGNGIVLIKPDFENNRNDAVLMRFAKNITVIGSYTEYGQVVLGDCQDVKFIGGYLGGNAESAKFYAEQAGTFYTVNATAGQTVFNVVMTGFDTMPKESVQIRVNNVWLAPSGFSKTGATITLTTPLNAGDIFDAIGNAVYPDSYYLENDNERYPVARSYNVLLQSVRNVEFETTEFDSPIIDAYAVNDSVFGTASSHIQIKPSTYNPSRTSTQVINKTRDKYLDGYTSKIRSEGAMEIVGALSIKDASDANYNVSAKRKRVILADDATTTYTASNNGFGLVMLMGQFGGLIVSANSGAGANIGFSGASSSVATGSTNPDTDGKFNVYSAGSGVIGIKNRLGVSTTFAILELHI